MDAFRSKKAKFQNEHLREGTFAVWWCIVKICISRQSLDNWGNSRAENLCASLVAPLLLSNAPTGALGHKLAHKSRKVPPKTHLTILAHLSKKTNESLAKVYARWTGEVYAHNLWRNIENSTFSKANFTSRDYPTLQEILRVKLWPY